MTREEANNASAALSSCADVLTKLSHQPNSALAQLLLQHGSSIGVAVQLALTDIAREELVHSSIPLDAGAQDGSPALSISICRSFLDSLSIVLTHTLDRGDPSLTRVLLPGSSSLLDLAVAVGLASSTTSAKLRSILRSSLIDSHLAAQILVSLSASLHNLVIVPGEQLAAQQQASDTDNLNAAALIFQIQRRMRMLSLFLRALPSPSSSSTSASSTRGGDPYSTVLLALASDLAKVHDVILPACTKLYANGDEQKASGAALEAAQLHTRDAALALVLLFRPNSASPASMTAIDAVIKSFRVQTAASGLKQDVVKLDAGALPLIGVLRARFWQDSQSSWDELSIAFKKHAPAATPADLSAVSLVPDERLLVALRNRTGNSSAQASKVSKNAHSTKRVAKGKNKAGQTQTQLVDSGLVATVQSVLPHLDTAFLQRKLRKPKYMAVAHAPEQIIDLLLESTSADEDEGVDGEQEDESSSSSDEIEEGGDLDIEPYQPPQPIVGRTTRRANIFDDEGPLDLSKFRYKSNLGSGGASASTISTPGLNLIPSDLKASVLARVAAQQREEAEAEDEEWDFDGSAAGGGGAFAAAGLASQYREAGFEEELEEEEGVGGAAADGDQAYIARSGGGMDWVGRRGMTTSLAASSDRNAAGRVPSAREWRRRIEDESDGDEDEDEDENAGGGPSTAGFVPPSGVGASSSATAPSGAGVASERAAERIMIRYYAQHGAPLYARDPALKKGNNPVGLIRRQLIAELDSATDRKWDHSLIESWATMFERN
ncbi:hypothetical protein OC845_002501, partial [Tilletia horrida]